MPIFEYTCEKCQTRFERLVKSAAAECQSPCPKCGSKSTHRALSVFAVASDSGKSSSTPPGTCGRCGGPGPCGMN